MAYIMVFFSESRLTIIQKGFGWTQLIHKDTRSIQMNFKFLASGYVQGYSKCLN